MRMIIVASKYTEKKYVFYDIHPHNALVEAGKIETKYYNECATEDGEFHLSVNEFMLEYLRISKKYDTTDNLAYVDNCGMFL